jgi:hypothetical protein
VRPGADLSVDADCLVVDNGEWWRTGGRSVSRRPARVDVATLAAVEKGLAGAQSPTLAPTVTVTATATVTATPSSPASG